MKKALSLLIGAIMVFALIVPFFRIGINADTQPAVKSDDCYSELTVEKAPDESTRDTVYMNSGLASIPKLSKQEIYQLLRDNPTTMPSNVFVTAPTYNPYTTGELTQEVLNITVNRLNALRQICGLAPVALDIALCQNAQYGAVLQACLPSLNHTPPESSKPEGMTDEFFSLGYEASRSSNLYAGRDLTRTPDGFMNDSDSGNISRVGHRRWQLNPEMGKIGFGYAEKSDSGFGKYTCEKVFDDSVTPGEYDFISWPSSGNFPNNTDGFNSNTAWSVSFDLRKYSALNENDITVTITRESDGTSWTLDSTCKNTGTRGKYLTVSTGGIGSGTCLIFRPDGITKYEGIYTVVIEGVKDRSGNAVACSFYVDFFDASRDPDVPTPVPTAVPTATPVPTPTPEPTDIPTDGELITEKSVVLEANGTYTLSFGAYSTGTLHDASSVLKFYFDGEVSLPSSVSLNVVKYKCLRYENGEPVFSSYGTSIYSDDNVSVSYYAHSPNRLLLNVSGFDFYSNTVSYSGGYKIVVKVYGVSPRYADALGKVQTNVVSRTGIYQSSSASAPDAVFPDENIFIESRQFAYDFGTQCIYSEAGSTLLSIDSAFPKYTKENNAYVYSTSLPASGAADPTYSAVLTNNEVAFEPLSTNAGSVSMNALIRLANGSYEWSKLTFLPASVVLYEEDLINFTDGSDGSSGFAWTSAGSPGTAAQTTEGVFGYDASYSENTGDSNNSVKQVTVTAELNEAIAGKTSGAAWPKASFKFTGTGVDLLSRCGADTAALVIDLVPIDKAFSYSGANSMHCVFDTYTSDGTFYQSPVLHAEDLAYGTYKVRVLAYYADYLDHQASGSVIPGSALPGIEDEILYEFIAACDDRPVGTRGFGSLTAYIDGVRVYHPLGTDAVYDDNETGAEYKNIRAMLKSQPTSSQNSVLNFSIDGATRTVTPSSYEEISPLNEVFIKDTMGVAFMVSGEYNAIHLSLKSPTGDGFKLKINDQVFKGSDGNALVIAHTSELYYDITDYVSSNGMVSIVCEAEGNVDAVLSIVTLKIVRGPQSEIDPILTAPDELIEFVQAINFGILGDVDGSGFISVADALAVMRCAMTVSELSAYGRYCADINSDGSIDITDALAIIRLTLSID